MPEVKVYTSSCCCYCHMAKELLRQKGAAFEEIDVTGRPDLRAELRDRSGGRQTVPQIWIGSVHVGGCDDLLELERDGKLDPMLSQQHHR
jgi:glutaredoxin 3